MTSSSTIFSQVLAKTGPALLTGIQRGLEKEGLRVAADSGLLSQRKHPEALGSALTHPAITTDYSESLLEFITGVSNNIDDSLDELGRLQRFTSSVLDNEVVWGASMPCIVTGDRGIPIAHYGDCNIGYMKRVYRNGLAVRYGRMMQAIAGIHYNFSLPDTLWQQAWREAGEPGSLQDFKTNGYLDLIRNFFSRAWFLIYMTGASPSVCASFLSGRKNHPLEAFDEHRSSLYLPYATSLRMGDLGYNSDAQAGLSVCYNSLDNYIRTLHRAIVEPHEEYSEFKVTDEGEMAQLNDSLLQIENEFYSPIRPKRVTQSGEAPLLALQRRGIEYIEVRCVDINPFLPLGIDQTTIRLLDTFLLDCLLSPSPLCDDESRQRDKLNLKRVVSEGRKPDLTLLTPEGELPFSEVARSLLERLKTTAAQLDAAHGGSDYQAAIDLAGERLDDPSKTPSGRVLDEMRASGKPFWKLALDYSKRWHQQFHDQPLSAAERDAMVKTAAASLHDLATLEAAQEPDFEHYLADFFAQYHLVKI